MLTSRKAKERMDSFSARGSKCPICHKPFRNGCDHSIIQAETKLEADYICALAREEYARCEIRSGDDRCI